MSNTEESLLTPDASLLDIDDADDLFIKPKKKYKVLMLSDHQLAPSGVGVQARFLIEGLIATGKYSFKCFGGAIHHEKYDVQVVNEDFIIRPVDGFGTREMVREFLITEQPDAVLLFTDPRQFIWLWEIEDEIHQICPITYWHVWDNDPYPEFNSPWYESTDLINCLSKKTYDLVQPHFPEKTNYIPHAFPKGLYQPVPKEQLDQLAQQNFSDKADWFKVLWVNRNATRKMPADVLTSWGKFLENLEKKHGHKKALLIMHTDPGDKEGPNLLAVTNHLQINDNVWFSTDKVDFQNMNLLHNLTDTTVNVAKNEGFGLTTLASLMCGKPIIALCTGGETSKAIDPKDGSANGVAIQPVKRSMVGSQLVPYIYEDLACNEQTADAFMTIFEMTDEDKEKMKEKVLEFTDREFNYENMIKKWDETLEASIKAYKAQKESGRGSWDLTIMNPVVNVSVEEEKDKK
jgi:glycosyltransferase involved in cell wall biosynthesis